MGAANAEVKSVDAIGAANGKRTTTFTTVFVGVS